MNSLAFEKFESLDADCLVQFQGEGWVTDVGCATVGAISGAIGGAASGYKASAW